jgi:hypothetical protein
MLTTYKHKRRLLNLQDIVASSNIAGSSVLPKCVGTKKERFRDLAFLLTAPRVFLRSPLSTVTAGKNTLSKLTYKVVYQA